MLCIINISIISIRAIVYRLIIVSTTSINFLDILFMKRERGELRVERADRVGR